MKSVSSTALKQSLGDVLAAAAREPVTITRHGTPRYVLMSLESYERRERTDSRKVYRVEDTPDDLADLLIAALDHQIETLNRE